MWYARDPDDVVHYLRSDLGETPCIAKKFTRLSVERTVTCLFCLSYEAGIRGAIDRLRQIKEEVKNWHKP